MSTIALPDPATEARLLARRHVTPEGCWEWIGSRRNGYGRISVQGRLLSAHRLSAHLWLDGFTYDSPLMVCHRCDNPPCFNPAHLFAGTAWDNMQDASAKGRIGRSASPRETVWPRVRACAACGTEYQPDGAHRGRSIVCSTRCLSAWRSLTRKGRFSKVTPQQVERMRAAVAGGSTYAEVGALFGVSAATAHRQINGRKGAFSWER